MMSPTAKRRTSPRTSKKLTSCADFFLVDGSNFDRLRNSFKINGIVAAQVAPVLKLGIAPAVEGPGIVAKPLAVARASREEDVVHGDHCHVLLRARVAAVRQS